GGHAGSARGVVPGAERQLHLRRRLAHPAHQGGMSVKVYRAEYIWIDGTEPTKKLRSKAKIVPAGEEPPIWAFDGSSTQQATGDKSDCVLQPVFVVPDPIRGEDNKLVLCEVMLVSGQPHPTNHRRANVEMETSFT